MVYMVSDYNGLVAFCQADIPNCVSSNIYADEILIYLIISCNADSDKLQEDLANVV